MSAKFLMFRAGRLEFGNSIREVRRSQAATPRTKLQETLLNRIWILPLGLYRKIITLPRISGADIPRCRSAVDLPDESPKKQKTFLGANPS